MLELGRSHGLMSAAAQSLHDDLHVHRAEAPGRDVDAAAHLHGHEAGLHVLDGQQVVGRLSDGHPGLGGHLAADGDGAAPVHLGFRYQPGLGGVLHHAHVKELAHPLGLRAVAAEGRRGFKGAHTGVQGEDGKIFNRESQIYLTGDWGTLGFGRVGGFSSGMSSLSWYWDFEPFETGYVDAGIQASQVNVWNVHSNTIYYVSPTYAGAKLGVQYSLTNEEDQEDARWVNNSKWLNVALRWDGVNTKVIGAVEAEFYGDNADTKNFEDAYSFKLAATWTPGGAATTLYAGMNYITNYRRISDANWNDFDIDGLAESYDGYDAISGFLGVRYTVGAANWLAQVQYQDGEFEGAASGQDGDFKRYAVGLGCHYYFSNRTMGYAVVSWAKGEGWLNKDENITNRTAASLGLVHYF